jgi:hypothetical protein
MVFSSYLFFTQATRVSNISRCSKYINGIFTCLSTSFSSDTPRLACSSPDISSLHKMQFCAFLSLRLKFQCLRFMAYILVFLGLTMGSFFLHILLPRINKMFTDFHVCLVDVQFQPLQFYPLAAKSGVSGS